MLKKIKISLAICAMLIGAATFATTANAQIAPPPHHGTPPSGGTPPTPGTPSAQNLIERSQRELHRAYDELGRLYDSLNADGMNDEQASTLLARGEELYATAYSAYDSANYTAAVEYARAAVASARAGRQALIARFGAVTVVNPGLRLPPVIAPPFTNVYQADRELQDTSRRLSDATYAASQVTSINVQSDLALAQSFYNQAVARYQSGDYAGAVAYSRVARETLGIAEALLRAAGSTTTPQPPANPRSMRRNSK